MFFLKAKAFTKNMFHIFPFCVSTGFSPGGTLGTACGAFAHGRFIIVWALKFSTKTLRHWYEVKHQWETFSCWGLHFLRGIRFWSGTGSHCFCFFSTEACKQLWRAASLLVSNSQFKQAVICWKGLPGFFNLACDVHEMKQDLILNLKN